MFLVIDGIDASGKKTQVELLSKKLQDAWKTVKIVDFPRYDNQSSYFAQKYLSGDYGANVSAEMSSLFFMMDRYDASFQLREDLKAYDYVIANRYTSASMIHHGCKIHTLSERTKFLDWLEHMEYVVCSLPKPDVIFFLSLSFENNMKLLEKRLSTSRKPNPDIHERDTVYMKQAWETAHSISWTYGWNTINCEEQGKLLSRDEITQKLFEQLHVWKK